MFSITKSRIFTEGFEHDIQNSTHNRRYGHMFILDPVYPCPVLNPNSSVVQSTSTWEQKNGLYLTLDINPH